MHWWGCVRNGWKWWSCCFRFQLETKYMFFCEPLLQGLRERNRCWMYEMREIHFLFLLITFFFKLCKYVPCLQLIVWILRGMHTVVQFWGYLLLLFLIPLECEWMVSPFILVVEDELVLCVVSIWDLFLFFSFFLGLCIRKTGYHVSFSSPLLFIPVELDWM